MTAIISDCSRYRYTLERELGAGGAERRADQPRRKGFGTLALRGPGARLCQQHERREVPLPAADDLPALSQVGELPGGGVSGIKQRRQGVTPGMMVSVCPSAPRQPP